MKKQIITFKKNHNIIKLKITTEKNLSQQNIKTLKDLIYKNFIENNKYNFDMVDYFKKESNYKNITIYNIKYIYYFLNMCNKKAVLTFTI